MAFWQRICLRCLFVVAVKSLLSTSVTAAIIDSPGYNAWWTERQSAYRHRKSLSTTLSDDEATLHWSIDGDTIRIAIAVVSESSPAINWIGFGLAESGGMRGADIVTFSNNSLIDGHCLDVPTLPIPDDCQSWNLLSSNTSTNTSAESSFSWLLFEAERLLDTGDPQDIAIRSNQLEPHRMIAAWGEESTPSFHGPNVAKGAIDFFANTTNAVSPHGYHNEAEGSFVLLAQNYLLPAQETKYRTFCFTKDDVAPQNVTFEGVDMHLIAIEPIIDQPQYVHHFILKASTNCQGNSAADEMVYGWAPGGLPLVLPPNVGIALGDRNSFRLQVHYNNPALAPDVVDNSGVRFYYVTGENKRTYDLGVMQLGDPFVQLRGDAVSSSGGMSQHVFDCPATCTQTFFPSAVNVIKESLHMHRKGVAMDNIHMRNGQVMRRSLANYWDFDQQGSLNVVQQPYQILPGDSFQTRCTFEGDSDLKWGLGSNEEMCIAYIYYYPRISPITVCALGVGRFVPECAAAVSTQSTNITLNRSFGYKPSRSDGGNVCAPPEQLQDPTTLPPVPVPIAGIPIATTCNICGEGFEVGKPNDSVDASRFGLGTLDCGSLDEALQSGSISLPRRVPCVLLPSLIGKACGCQPIALNTTMSGGTEEGAGPISNGNSYSGSWVNSNATRTSQPRPFTPTTAPTKPITPIPSPPPSKTRAEDSSATDSWRTRINLLTVIAVGSLLFQ